MQFRANVSEAMNEEYSDWLCLYVIKMCVCVCVKVEVDILGSRP